MASERIERLRMKVMGKTTNKKVRQPVAYGYTRVSHKNSFEKGDSLPAQEHRIKLYHKNNLEDQGIPLISVENDGTNVSAYSTSFRKRPAGKILCEKLRPGDHLILDKPDRIWRSMEDFCNLMADFRKKGISVHIVNFLGESIQNDTPLGDFTLRLVVLIAELESSIKSERIKEGLEARRRKVGYYGNAPNPPCGVETYKTTVDGEEVWRLRWDKKVRTVMNELVRLRDEERLEWSACFPLINKFEADLYGREPAVTETYDGYKERWYRLYKTETAYRYLGIVDPYDIPKQDIIREAQRQARRVRSNKTLDLIGRGNEKSEIKEIITPEELLNLA